MPLPCGAAVLRGGSGCSVLAEVSLSEVLAGRVVDPCGVQYVLILLFQPALGVVKTLRLVFLYFLTG